MYFSAMNFLIILPTLKQTGGTQIAREYANILQENGHQVEIIGFWHSAIPDFWHPLPTRAISLPWPHKITVATFYLPAFFHLERQLKFISGKNTNYQIMTIYTPLAFILTILHIFRHYPIPRFIIHDSPRQKWVGGIAFRLMIPWIINRIGPAKVAIVNQALQRSIPNKKASQLLEIPNAIIPLDTPRINKNPQQLLYIGATDRAKGWDHLLEFAGLLTKELPRYQIHCFIGTSRTPRPPVPPNLIIYPPHTSREILKTCLQQSFVLLNFSRSESFCLPVLEAMASDTIAIATPTIGAGQLIENGKNGFLLQSQYPQEAISILQHLNTLEQRQLEKIWQCARKKAIVYSPERMTERLIKFITPDNS